jgi:hypothetical protein
VTQQVIACVDACTVPFALVARAHVQITDPPYSRHVHANITSAGTTGDKSRGYHKQELAFGHLTPKLRRHIARCAATVAGWSLIFSDIESAHLWRFALTAAAAQVIRTVPHFGSGAHVTPADYSCDEEGNDNMPGYAGALPWVRWSQPQKSGDRPTQGAELVTHAWGGKGRKRWYGPGSLVSYDAKALRGSDKHRTQKPLRLMLQMVSWFSAPGETVFDPCAGRGTTGQACRLLDREFWGCELDPEECARAAARLAGVLSDADRREARAFAEEQRSEALAVLALPRTVHPKTGKFTDEQTRARATRRLSDADHVAGRIATLAA